MTYQLRIYTINLGMMDEWVVFFIKYLVPMLQNAGMQISGAWVNEDKNQFIWIRGFDDSLDLKATEAAFVAEVRKLPEELDPRKFFARMDVQTMHRVWSPSDS